MKRDDLTAEARGVLWRRRHALPYRVLTTHTQAEATSAAGDTSGTLNTS